MRRLPSILLIAITLLFGSGALRVVHQASHAFPHSARHADVLSDSGRTIEATTAPRSACGVSCAFHRHAAPTPLTSSADRPTSRDSDRIPSAPLSPDAPAGPGTPSDGHCDHDCGLCLFLATAAAPLTAPSGVVGELLERAGRLSVPDLAVRVTIDLRIDSTRGPPRSVRSV